MGRERLNVVIVGHVDHGKSTVLGRLLSDTDSVAKGKLEEIKESCKRNSRTFEYAFLLDALKDERSQGITIDIARRMFKGANRDYLFIDAPGHIDFLKNMVSGASRAEAAVLVIDAHEGIKENSKRHGYLLSMLGINEVIVCVNKMDLVKYSEDTFKEIKDSYTKFLSNINILPKTFIPLAAREGENVAARSSNMTWYKGPTLLESLGSLKKAGSKEAAPFRMPVQDIYKFTKEGDDRRLIAGKVESGSISVKDEVVFYPSEKRSAIKTIEMFNSPPKKEIGAGYSTSFTLSKEVYVEPGEIMCRAREASKPNIATLLKVNVFWMGKSPLTVSKEYKLKLGTAKVYARVKEIRRVLDASNLETSQGKTQADKWEVAECVIETEKTIAFDLITDFEATGRFVLVDDYEIAGGGIVTGTVSNGHKDLKDMVNTREIKWVQSDLPQSTRLDKYAHKPRLILITGKKEVNKVDIAKKLEAVLSEKGYPAYYIGIRSVIYGVDADIKSAERYRDEHLRRLSEVIHILLDAGLTVISTASDLHENDIESIGTILKGQEVITVIVGENYFVEKTADLEVKEGDKAAQEISSYYSGLR
jgi:bifunctional enzyme CysN/CysC